MLRLRPVRPALRRRMAHRLVKAGPPLLLAFLAGTARAAKTDLPALAILLVAVRCCAWAGARVHRSRTRRSAIRAPALLSLVLWRPYSASYALREAAADPRLRDAKSELPGSALSGNPARRPSSVSCPQPRFDKAAKRRRDLVALGVGAAILRPSRPRLQRCSFSFPWPCSRRGTLALRAGQIRRVSPDL